jgi:hypothetical protein
LPAVVPIVTPDPIGIRSVSEMAAPDSDTSMMRA